MAIWPERGWRASWPRCPKYKKFLFVFGLALAATHLFVVLAVLGEAELMEAASVGFIPPVYLWLL